MSKLLGVPGLLAVCAIVVLLSLLGLASVVLTRLGSDIDGLLLLMICLMMGGIFSLMIFVLAKEAGWLPARRGPAPAGKAPAANPGAAKSGEEKS